MDELAGLVTQQKFRANELRTFMAYIGGFSNIALLTVSGGTLDAPVLKPAFNAQWISTNGVVTLAADCAVNGKLRVDVGRTAGNPLLAPYPRDILVALYADSTPPDVTQWNILRTDGTEGLRGIFVAANGEIRMTVKNPSTVLVFR